MHTEAQLRIKYRKHLPECPTNLQPATNLQPIVVPIKQQMHLAPLYTAEMNLKGVFVL